METIFFTIIILSLILFVLIITRLPFVSSFQEELHDFIFNDPSRVVDYSQPKQEYEFRLEWKLKELDSFDAMMLKFWIWPMSRFIKGSFAEKFFEWRRAGKPLKTDRL